MDKEFKNHTTSMPVFTDERVLVKAWVNIQNTKRVFIYRNPNDTWGLCSEYFSDNEYEMCWVGEDMGGHFYDSEQTAINEVSALFPWSKELEPQNI